MIYERTPFKYTRSPSNPLKAYGKNIGADISPWKLLEMDFDFQSKISGSAKVEDSTIDESNGPVHIGENVVVERSVIRGPAWLSKGTKVGPGALIRSGSIGKNCKIGQSTEIKNSFIMEETNVPHLSYVGDSIIGSEVNLAAGTIVSNLRHDEKNIELRFEEGSSSTGRRKIGALIGDCVKTGANTSIYEGRIIGPFAVTGPGSTIKNNLGPFSKRLSGKLERMDKDEAIRIFPSYREKIKEVWNKICAE